MITSDYPDLATVLGAGGALYLTPVENDAGEWGEWFEFARYVETSNPNQQGADIWEPASVRGSKGDWLKLLLGSSSDFNLLMDWIASVDIAVIPARLTIRFRTGNDTALTACQVTELSHRVSELHVENVKIESCGDKPSLQAEMGAELWFSGCALSGKALDEFIHIAARYGSSLELQNCDVAQASFASLALDGGAEELPGAALGVYSTRIAGPSVLGRSWDAGLFSSISYALSGDPTFLLEGHSALKSLEIGQVSSKFASTLSKSSLVNRHIRKLTIWGTKLDRSSFCNFLRASNLVEVSVNGTVTSRVGETPIQFGPKLRVFHLDGLRGPVLVDVLNALNGSAIANLGLRNCTLHDADIDKVLSIPDLRKLDLRANFSLTEGILVKLATLEHLSGLAIYELGDSLSAEDIFEALPGLQSLFYAGVPYTRPAD